jgi:hypothetical protein
MTVPAYARTWRQLLTSSNPGNRITYVSLTDAAQNTFYQTKAAMCGGLGQTTPMTVVWSASNGTGPTNSSDHTDRITSSSTVTPQASTAAASQAWVVMLDGNARAAWAGTTNYTQGQYVTNSGNVYVCRTTGISASSGGPTGTGSNISDNTAAWQYLQAGTGAGQILFTYQGATADVFRISYSPGALFTLASTTNNQPTATDEEVICSATSIVGSTTSGDRILQVWVSDDAKAWKMMVLRAGAMAGPLIGTENINEGVTQFPVSGSASVATLPNPVWGFCYTTANLVANQLTTGFTANAKGGLMRMLVSGVFYAGQAYPAVECIAPGGTLSEPTNTINYQAELQGASGYPYWPLALYSTNTVGARGRLGTLIDWYISSPSGVALGDGYGPSYQWIQNTELLLPNPSANPPTLT